MAVYQISANVNAQNIAIDLGDVQLVSGSDNVYQVEFEFSDEWSSFTKKVVFYTEWKRSIIEVLLSGTNIVTIPTRSLANSGFLMIGVYGTGTNDEKLPTVWSQKLHIYEGTCQGYENPAAPDPDVYDEILAAMAGKADVSLVNSNMTTVKGMLNIHEVTNWQNGGFPTAVGSTIDFDHPASASTKKCAYASVSEGDFVYFSVSQGSSSYRAYAYLDEDKKVLVNVGVNSFTGNRCRTVPKGAKWIIFNSNRSHDSYACVGSFAELIARLTGQFGNVGMFNSIAVCGTSWDAGYFYANGHAYEKRNKSWVKLLGAMYGVTAYNFGVVSGTTCKADSSWIGTDGAVSWQGNENGLPALLASNVNRTLYFMDLVQNDATKLGSSYLGTIADINDSDYTQNPDTFYGNYGRIIEQIKAKDPKALFIFMYKGGDQVSTIENTYATALAEIAAHYGAPIINWMSDAWFNGWVYSRTVSSHPTIGTYAAMAKCADRLFSEVMRTNWEYFKDYNPLDE